MTKVLLGLLLGLVILSGLQTWRLSGSQAEATRLRSTVLVLQGTLARNSRATAAHKKLLVKAQAEATASAQALERALVASPEWTAGSVPKEVQDAP